MLTKFDKVLNAFKFLSSAYVVRSHMGNKGPYRALCGNTGPHEPYQALGQTGQCKATQGHLGPYRPI